MQSPHPLTRQLAYSLTLLLLASNAHAQLLPDGYTLRRPLNFKQQPSDAPGPNAAVVETWLDGSQKPDASDLRVTTAERLIVPHKILQASPKDDFVRLAFESKSDGPYYLWWNNPKLKEAAPEKQLDIKRGIYTEIFRPPPNLRKQNLQNLDKLFESATPLAATFVPDIFLAYNPLGPEWDVMFRYTGQFKIDKPITADFAFTVADSGSLAIDGKQIAHVLRDKLHGKVRDPHPLELAAGWHSIEVTQASLDGGQMGVVVAWKRSDDKNYSPLPAKLFAPVVTATAGPLERLGSANTFAADFTITPEAEAFSPPDAYLQRYAFNAEFPATFKPTLTWDFGDGQFATTKNPSHIYLSPGTYTVTLKLTQNAATDTATRRITIKDRMYQKFPRPPEDPAKTTATILSSYDLAKLPSEQLLRGYLFLKANASPMPGAVAAWGKAWLQSPIGKDISEKSLFDETFDFARFLEAQADYTGAADAFRLASQKNNFAMPARLNLLRHCIMTTCNDTDDGASALKEAQDWQKKINDSDKNQQRILLSATLYAAIAKADKESSKLAQSTLDQLKALDNDKVANLANYNDQQIRQGVLARNIENYIRTKEFDTALKLIEDWELEFPEATWDGFTRTLRVKLAAAEKNHLAAARIALQHARANPAGVYAAELLYRASEYFKLANEPTQSKAALDLLAAKYPESPYARQNP